MMPVGQMLPSPPFLGQYHPGGQLLPSVTYPGGQLQPSGQLQPGGQLQQGGQMLSTFPFSSVQEGPRAGSTPGGQATSPAI
jgi:hypothetical protein